MTVRALLLSTLLAAVTFGSAAADAPKAAKEPVAVAMYDGPGVGGKGPGMLEEKFHADTEFRITRLKPEDIRAGKLKGFKALIVPGGSSKGEGAALGADGRDEVRKFVADGGCYVGICAGCYLASSHYEWSLNLLPVEVVDSANWGRGRASLKVEFTPAGKEWFARSDAEAKTIYHNGPVIRPKKGAEKQVVPLAVYREEITRKGAKEGLMVNTAAVAAGKYGKGWAVGVSPHPEQTDGLKDLVPSAIRWALAQPASAGQDGGR